MISRVHLATSGDDRSDLQDEASFTTYLCLILSPLRVSGLVITHSGAEQSIIVCSLVQGFFGNGGRCFVCFAK